MKIEIQQKNVKKKIFFFPWMYFLIRTTLTVFIRSNVKNLKICNWGWVILFYNQQFGYLSNLPINAQIIFL